MVKNKYRPQISIKLWFTISMSKIVGFRQWRALQTSLFHFEIMPVTPCLSVHSLSNYFELQGNKNKYEASLHDSLSLSGVIERLPDIISYRNMSYWSFGASSTTTFSNGQKLSESILWREIWKDKLIFPRTSKTEEWFNPCLLFV